MQAHVFFLTSLLSPHRDVYVYVDGVNDDDDVVFFLTSLVSPHVTAL